MSFGLTSHSFAAMECRSIVRLLVVLPVLIMSGCGQRSGDQATTAAHEPRTHAVLLMEARKRAARDCSKDLKFMAASAALGGAREQIKLEDYRRANIRLRDGLETLGDVILGDDVLDDTEQRLAHAWAEEWNGRYQPAADGRQRILTARLADYAQLHNLQQCPSPSEAVGMELPLPAHSSVEPS